MVSLTRVCGVMQVAFLRFLTSVCIGAHSSFSSSSPSPSPSAPPNDIVFVVSYEERVLCLDDALCRHCRSEATGSALSLLLLLSLPSCSTHRFDNASYLSALLPARSLSSLMPVPGRVRR